jgi:hypothetical protein
MSHFTCCIFYLRGSCPNRTANRWGSCTQEDISHHTYCIFDLRGNCPNRTPHPRDSCTQGHMWHYTYHNFGKRGNCCTNSVDRQGSGMQQHMFHSLYRTFEMSNNCLNRTHRWCSCIGKYRPHFSNRMFDFRCSCRDCRLHRQGRRMGQCRCH